MVDVDTTVCPNCHGELKYYDSVRRIVRTKYGRVDYIVMRRMKCCECHSLHREIPDAIFPYKHYEKEIIIGVVEGLITYNTLGFEDYPSELTMKRWIKTIDISHSAQS